MGKKRVEIDVGAFRSGSDGMVSVDKSVLSMDGADAASTIGRIFAVLDGPDAVVDHIHDCLVKAYCSGSPAEAVDCGYEERYLDRVLDRITLNLKSHGTLAIGIAVQVGSEVVLATLGGAEAVLCRESGALDSVPDTVVEGTQGARIWRTDIHPGDSVVLGGRPVAAHVIPSEMRQTVQAGFSVEHASQWLTTLASTRSQKAATALVARVKPDEETPRRPALGAPSRFPRISMPRPSTGPVPFVGGFVALALAFSLIGVIILGAVFPGQSGVAAEPSAPYKLQAYLQPHSVLLSWQDSNPGTRAYVVMINGVAHTVTTPYIQLDQVLFPGRSYAWRVRALFPGEKTLTSKVASVSVPTAPALARPSISSPSRGPFPASQAKAIKFCWTAPWVYTKFRLMIGGAKHHFNSQLSRSLDENSTAIPMCATRALRPGVYYAWQVGASGLGYKSTLSAWQHFSISAVPTPTPTPVIVPPVVSTPAPVYNGGSYNSAPTTGYNSAPTTGYNTAPSTGYNTGTTSSPPPPVTTPVATSPPGDVNCPNPPNCS